MTPQQAIAAFARSQSALRGGHAFNGRSTNLDGVIIRGDRPRGVWWSECLSCRRSVIATAKDGLFGSATDRECRSGDAE